MCARWPVTRESRYGMRGFRIGEASNPGPPTLRISQAVDESLGQAHRVRRVADSPRVEDDEGLTGTRRRRRRLRPLPWSWDDTDSDEETHPTHADFVRLWSPGEMANCPRQFRQVRRRKKPEEVPLHVVDALQEDLDPLHTPRSLRSSNFQLSVQNRFAALDATVRDSSGLRPTSVDGVDIFPMTDDAATQVPVEPVRRRPYRRLVLILQSQGTPQSVQDRHDVSEDEARHVVPQDPISSDAELVDEVDSPVMNSDMEDERESASVISEVVEEFEVVEENVAVPRVVQAAIREGFRALDEVNLVHEFSRRAAVMQNIPSCVKGPFRNAMRLSLEEMTVRGDAVRQERGWKLFMLLPRLLLRPARGGLISRKKLEDRFADFGRGEWMSLEGSRKCAEEAATAHRRRRRRARENDVEKRAARALNFVQLGELSSARQALEGADLAPGNDETLRALRQRPAFPQEPIPPALMQLRPPRQHELDDKLLGKNLKSATRGAAGGPSGMTTEHLRPLLDSQRDMHLFHEVCQQLARAEVSQTIVDAIRLGRMTALTKPNGGVRGIVAGDVIRRLTARTIAQQLGKVVEAATAPFQCALSTRAGCEACHA